MRNLGALFLTAAKSKGQRELEFARNTLEFPRILCDEIPRSGRGMTQDLGNSRFMLGILDLRCPLDFAAVI